MSGEAAVLVIGGGIAGLAAAHRVAEAGHGGGLVLVEREPRLGGKVATERVDGFVIEGGPDCFLAAKPAGLELCRALGIEERVRGTDPRLQRSFVKRDGLLHELPAGLTGLVPSRIGPLLTTSVLSVPGRLRAALELVVPRRRDGAEETVAGFVRRRFGAEAWDWLVEPLLSGIFAGDGSRLSLPATFPMLVDLERRHGGILRMMLLESLVPRRSPEEARAGPAQGFVTLAGGLGELVDALEASLPPGAIRRGAAVGELERRGDLYEAVLTDGTRLAAPAVVLATPAFAAADLVDPFDPELAATLREIPFVSSATVSVAFGAADVPRTLPGYGYVTPRVEGGDVVACTWTSNKFPGRAPGDGVLLRFFLGRAGREEIAAAGDEEIRAVIRAELGRVLGIRVEPMLWRIYRWPRGLPQYTLGHPRRMQRIAARLALNPGLTLAGASYRGVGLPDCIASGRAAAEAALARLKVGAT